MNLQKSKTDIRQFFSTSQNWKSLALFVVTLLLLEAISGIHYLYTHNLLDDELERLAISHLDYKAQTLHHTMNTAEQRMEDYLWDIQRNLHDPDSISAVTRRLLPDSGIVEGVCLAFVPDYYPSKGRLFEPYAHRSGDSAIVEQLGNEEHDYTKHPTFQWAVEHRKKTWSDPYVYDSESGPQALTSFAYPLTDGKGNLVAVVGLDVSLSWLGATLNMRQFYPSSFCLFLTPGGQLISGPSNIDEKWQQEVARLINDSTVKAMPTTIPTARMKSFYDKGKDDTGYIYYMQMEHSPYWQVALVCYDKEAFGALYTIRRQMFLVMLAGFLLLGFIVYRYVRNLIHLQEADMEKKRISGELRIARDIQKQMLPESFPPFPERHDIDIFGSLEPAKEVGGDLFDFFIRDEHLFFCIGDVSGKGVPSALVMAQTHSLFRMVAGSESDPARMMQAINRISCEGNESNMFVTFFLGVLDLATGHLCYCNAGHDQPFLLRDDAAPVLLSAQANIPLGVFNDFSYEAQEATLAPDTTIFLYTDGLTEAKNLRRKLFGMERITAALTPAATCQQLLEGMSEAVRRFVEDAEQSDDLTMLAIRYTP